MKRINLITGIFLSSFFLYAQTSTLPTIELVEFASGLTQPIGIEHAGDERLFVLEQPGRIRILDEDGNFQSHFLNISSKVHSDGFEQGLLGIAFDPDYEDNGYFYVHYTNLDRNSQFSRFSVNPNNPNKALPSSEVKFLEVEDPFGNHNGGQMKFGPDGYLYFTIGDGGAGGDPFNNAQDDETMLGKMLRIDPNDDGTYSIPPTNPYAGQDDTVEEIWATGLRNPWRFSFDLLTGDIWLPDVGQNAWEEVNFQPASSTGGENYGWSCMEGTHFFKADCDDNGVPFTDPIAEYEHSDDPDFLCSGSVTGGYIYRGEIYEDMYAKYIYTDFCTGVMRTTYWDGVGWVTAELGNFTPFAYSTFGEDINGELYLADHTSGTIYKVTDAGPSAFAAPDNPSYSERDRIVPGLTTISNSEAMINESEPFALSQNGKYKLSPNPNHGEFQLQFTSDQDQSYAIRIVDFMGRPILDEKRQAQAGPNEWRLNSSLFAEGMYYLQLQNNKELSTVKFVVD